MKKNTYLFYDVMKYPLPFQKEFFAYEEAVDTMKKPGEVLLSRGKGCENMDAFVKHVNHLGWLWKSLPFVDAIYIGNSMSFNALKPWSDIDLFFAVSPWRMWLARLCSNLTLLVLWLRRWRGYTHMKFCLSFYVESDKLNLQSIKYDFSDPYLIYRLAHLVNLYQRLSDKPVDVYEQNYRLREYLPTFPMEQVITLWTKQFTWLTWMKIFIERLFSGIVWDMFEWLIKITRIPFLLWKKKRLWPVGESIIISDHMLKFHEDKRKEYAMKWKIAGK